MRLYIYIYIYIYIHSVFCLTTGPKPPPKRCRHIVRSRASSFKREYPLPSLRSSSSFLRLLPRLLVTSISPFIFPSITCFRRQFLRKMWPTQLAFRFLISCRIYKCVCVCVCWYAWVTEDGESGLRCLADMLLANVWRFDSQNFTTILSSTPQRIWRKRNGELFSTSLVCHRLSFGVRGLRLYVENDANLFLYNETNRRTNFQIYIGTDGGHLWVRWWTFGFQKNGEFLD